MLSALRRQPSRSLVLAATALFLAFGGSALAVREVGAAKPPQYQVRCQTGAVKGIAIIIGDPKKGLANLTEEYTSAANVFGARWSCSGGAVQVRRQGASFDVRFVGNGAGSAIVSPWGGTPGAASVYRTTEGAFRVTIQGAGQGGAYQPRPDIPFILLAL
jgi:hypothetical protein